MHQAGTAAGEERNQVSVGIAAIGGNATTRPQPDIDQTARGNAAGGGVDRPEAPDAVAKHQSLAVTEPGTSARNSIAEGVAPGAHDDVVDHAPAPTSVSCLTVHYARPSAAHVKDQHQSKATI